MKISCDHCSATYEIDEARIPPAGLTLKCTRCLRSFQVKAPALPRTVMGMGPGGSGSASPSLPGTPAAPGASPATAPAAPTDGRYYIRRRSGKTFGPFVTTAIADMLNQGTIAGDEDVSLDGAHWIQMAQVPVLAERIRPARGTPASPTVDVPPVAPPTVTAPALDLAPLAGRPAPDGAELPGLRVPGAPTPVPLGAPTMIPPSSAPSAAPPPPAFAPPRAGIVPPTPALNAGLRPPTPPPLGGVRAPDPQPALRKATATDSAELPALRHTEAPELPGLRGHAPAPLPSAAPAPQVAIPPAARPRSAAPPAPAAIRPAAPPRSALIPPAPPAVAPPRSALIPPAPPAAAPPRSEQIPPGAAASGGLPSWSADVDDDWGNIDLPAPKGADLDAELPVPKGAPPATGAARFLAPPLPVVPDAIVDLPTPKGGGDGINFHTGSEPPAGVVGLPAPVAPQDVGMSALRGQSGNVGLPTPRSDGSTGLPTPRADGSVGLPTPRADGSVGLPTPRADGSVGLPTPRADGSVGLPVPTGYGETGLPTPRGPGAQLPEPKVELPGLHGSFAPLPVPAAGLPTPLIPELPQPAGLGFDPDFPQPHDSMPPLPDPPGSFVQPGPGSSGNLASLIDEEVPHDTGVPPSGSQELDGFGEPATARSSGLSVALQVTGDHDEVALVDAPAAHQGDALLPRSPADMEVGRATHDRAIDVGPKTRRPMPRAAVIGAGGLGAVLVFGLGLGFTDLGVFGLGDLGSNPSVPTDPKNPHLEAGHEAMRKDSFRGYDEAAKAFATAFRKNQELRTANALEAQALGARVVRFGSLPAELNSARVIVNGFTEENKGAEFDKARGIVALANKKADAAIASLAKAVSAAPKDVWAKVFLAWAQIKAGKLAAADKLLRAAIATDTRLAPGLFAMARVHAKKKSKETETWVTTTLNAAPVHSSALLMRAALQWKAKKADAATATWTKVIGLKENVPPWERSEAHLGLARVARLKGNLNEARKQYKAATSARPNNAPALHELGVMQFKGARFVDAMKNFKAAQIADPKNVRTVIMIARTSMRVGKPIEAHQVLRQMQKTAPNDAEIRYLLGRVDETMKEPDRAISRYEEAIKLNPKYFEAYQQLARLHVQRNERALAFKTLRRAEVALPKSAKLANAFGEAHLLFKALGEAAKKFKEALALDARLNVARYNLGLTLRQQGLADDALVVFVALDKRDAAHPGLAQNLAELYARDKRWKDAAKAYDRAIAHGAVSLALRAAAGGVYVRAGKNTKARQQADKLLLAPGYGALGRLVRGQSFYADGRWGDALIDAERSIERRPSAEAYALKARTQLQLKRPVLAADAFRKAVKLDGKRTDLRFEFARVLLDTRTIKEARTNIMIVVAAEPKNARAQYILGRSLYQARLELQALRSLRTAVGLDPKLAHAHERIGTILSDRVKHAEAVIHLAKALKLATDKDAWRVDAQFQLGRSYDALKQRAKAIEAYQRYLEIAPRTAAARSDAIRVLRTYEAPLQRTTNTP